MQRIKRIAKRLAAVSAGAVMLGSTMSGALAASYTLSDYPEPFINIADKKFDYLMVLPGSPSASAADAIAGLDIAAGLADTQVAGSGGGTVTVSGGVSEKVPLTLNIAAENQLDVPLTDSEVETLIDGQINFQGDEYDVSEELYFGKRNNVSIHTSLSSNDDDYGSEVRMEVDRNSINYIYSFDESMNVSLATSAQPLTIDFLGKQLKITSVSSATKATAQVGDQVVLTEGETTEVEGSTLKLKRVSSSNAIVDVDGTEKTISSGSTVTIGSVEVYVDSLFYDSNNADRNQATLVVGADAVQTIENDKVYFGGDGTCSNNDPEDPDCWKWIVQNLQDSSSTAVTNTEAAGFGYTGPTIGIKNNFAINSFRNDPPAAGECVDLPNDYLSVCFDSLTVTEDDDWLELTIERYTDFDSAVSDSTPFGLATGTAAIRLISDQDDSLRIDVDATGFTANGTLSADIKTKEIWLTPNTTAAPLETTPLEIYYYSPSDSTIKRAGLLTNGTGVEFGYIDFNKISGTSGTAILLNATITGTATENISIETAIHPIHSDLTAATDDLFINWSLDNSGADGLSVDALGNSASSAEAGELVWESTNLGTKDEDHRSKFGMIINNPESNGASDKVVIDIPPDLVEANVVIKGQSGATVTSGNSVSINSVDTAEPAVLSTEVSSIAGQNAILVGGSCVNDHTAAALGLTYPACGEASGLSAGEAIIQLVDNGDNVAMVVAGWEADDTRRAGKVLRNYSTYADDLTGTKVMVEGVSQTVSKVTQASASAPVDTTEE